MTILTYVNVEKVKKRYIIEIEGHNENTDVCTATSTLVATLWGYLENFCKGSSYKEGDGYCRIEASGNCRQAIEMFVIGIMRLKATVPDNINIDINT